MSLATAINPTTNKAGKYRDLPPKEQKAALALAKMAYLVGANGATWSTIAEAMSSMSSSTMGLTPKDRMANLISVWFDATGAAPASAGAALAMDPAYQGYSEAELDRLLDYLDAAVIAKTASL